MNVVSGWTTIGEHKPSPIFSGSPTSKQNRDGGETEAQGYKSPSCVFPAVFRLYFQKACLPLARLRRHFNCRPPLSPFERIHMIAFVRTFYRSKLKIVPTTMGSFCDSIIRSIVLQLAIFGGMSSQW